MVHRYEEDIKKLEHSIGEVEKNYSTISNIRLIVGILIIGLFVFSIYTRDSIFFLLFFCTCLVFAALLVIHDKISIKNEYIQAKYLVMKKRNDRINGNWLEFEELGSEFLNENSNVERNLDILGDNSLYQYLCVANTQEGREKLAAYLTTSRHDVELIYERQKAIKELIENQEFSLELEICSSFLNKKKGSKEEKWYQGFLNYLNINKELINPLASIGSSILPILSIVAILLTMKGRVMVEIPCALVLTQGFFAYYISYKNRSVTKEVFNFCLSIGSYFKIMKHIEQGELKSEYLKVLQNKFVRHSGISRGIVKLNRLNDAFVVQSNAYIHFLLQFFILYDIHCIRFLEKWKRKYASDMLDVFKIIGEFEALLSLSMIGLDGKCSFPEFVKTEEIYFQGKEMTHALIKTEKVISNSLYTTNGIEIITGSNMSGKTTFMRTIGINIVLAYAGAPVRAEHMKLSVMRIFTSMRVVDNVSKGISSFYGEVLRIKEMIEYSKEGKPMIVLIDEIFKGTNSADRIVGAKEVLKGLNQKHIIALVSTHDFELCKLVEENEVSGHNYHFEEHYQEDKIYFDYKIKDGKCKTTNAKYILKMAGLI